MLGVICEQTHKTLVYLSSNRVPAIMFHIMQSRLIIFFSYIFCASCNIYIEVSFHVWCTHCYTLSEYCISRFKYKSQILFAFINEQSINRLTFKPILVYIHWNNAINSFAFYAYSISYWLYIHKKEIFDQCTHYVISINFA